MKLAWPQLSSAAAPSDDAAPLPAGAEPLAAQTHAPPALDRRLAQTGVVADPATAAALQARAEPVYEEIEGWTESTEGARSWADLPAAAIKYVRRIEELIQCPVAMLSTSPERDDTILVHNPFEG